MCRNSIDPYERSFRKMIVPPSLTLLTIILLMTLPGFGQEKPGEAHQLNSQKRAGEKPAFSSEDVVRIGVTLVQVDAAVTDKKGHPVTDLTKDDFEIYEDGKRQQITNFSLISTPTPRTVENRPATQPNVTPPVPLPVVPLKPEQVNRTIAIVVDDLSMSMGSVEAARYHLRRFVDQQMQPGDLVAIIRASGGMGALQQFTSDKQQLYSAVERVKWNPRSLNAGQIGTFAQATDETLASKMNGRIEDDPKAEALRDQSEEFREQLFAVGVLGALNYVVRGLRDLPGRKSVMFISEGFILPTLSFSSGGRLQQPIDRVTDSLRSLIELANRSAVVIYAVDPRGIVVPMIEASDDVGSFSWRKRDSLISQRIIQLADSNNGMGYLAKATGGFLVSGSNDIGRGIRRVLDDQGTYYLIGYVPAESTFRRVAGRLQFHNISIKLKRSDLVVRSRSGFLGLTNEEVRRPRLNPDAELTAAALSPFESGDVHLKLTSLFGNDATTGYYVRSLLHINARDITFSEEVDGWRKGEIDVIAMAFGDNGTLVDSRIQTYSLSVRARSMDRTLRSGLVYEIDLPLKKPGAYQMRTGVRDAKSQKIGSANQYIEVPDLSKGRPVLSAIAVSGNDLLSGLNQSAYRSSSQNDEETRLEAGPAVRRLRAGDDLNYAFVVYNAKVDKATRTPHLLMQARLFRDGKLVYAGAPAPLQLSPQADWKRISVAGSLKLANTAQPGEHILQILITDELSKEKYRTRMQWTDFEIEK